MLSTEYALSPLVLLSTLEMETLLLSVLQSRKSRGAQADQHPRACQQQSWGLDSVPHSLSCSAQLLPGVQALLATAVVFTFHFIQSLVSGVQGLPRLGNCQPSAVTFLLPPPRSSQADPHLCTASWRPSIQPFPETPTAANTWLMALPLPQSPGS